MVTGAAYAHCQQIARRHYENFPVASWLLPRAARPHVAAIYAFARIADDFADEGARSPAERLSLLDDWQGRLEAAVHGDVVDDGTDASYVFTAVRESMRLLALEPSLFGDLLSAFRQDVTTTRYAGWNDLLDYCRRSANPIGRLVLRISGYRESGLDRMSDAMCTALQLTNFWQDLARDWHKGRLYVPQAIVAAAGADARDLDRREITPAWRSALAEAASVTRRLFADGRPIADAVRGRLRWELRATWLGGVRILDRLEAAGFEVFRERPALGRADWTRVSWRALTWRPSPEP